MDTCASGNAYDGQIGLRISSIFVILVGSLLGACFPVFASRKRTGLPPWTFFVAKYFGSGVIVATAFIHLLAPANDALRDPCLHGVITEYPWVEGISLMAIFALFYLELMMMRYGKFGSGHGHGAHSEPPVHSHGHGNTQYSPDHGGESTANLQPHDLPEEISHQGNAHTEMSSSSQGTDVEKQSEGVAQHQPVRPVIMAPAEPYAAQLTGVFILEFGVVFHSVFIGLTLAVAGKEFTVLYIVLAFHQTFEGLALGSRLAGVDWPTSRRWTPYILAVGYGISTPLAIAVGLGVRTTYHPGSQSSLIANGVFDSISAGILIYTGLIELMAHDFLYSTHMQCAPARKMLGAFITMCCGAFLMAILGKFA